MADTNEPDMDAPVTRRELHDALELWAGAIKAEIAQLITGLGAEIKAVRTELRTEIREVRTELREVIRTEILASEARLSAELRQHTDASKQELQNSVSVVDDQYKQLPARVTELEELPERVTRLEAKVFAPKRKRRS